MKQPSELAVRLVRNISQGSGEFSIEDTADLFGVNPCRLVAWTIRERYHFGDDLFDSSCWPALWMAFAQESGVCADMLAAFDKLVSEIQPGSRFEAWVETCRQEEIKAFVKSWVAGAVRDVTLLA